MSAIQLHGSKLALLRIGALMARGVSRSRMSAVTVVGGGLTVIVVVAVGTLALMSSLGAIDLKWLQTTKPLGPDMVRIPVSGGTIPAYTRIVRDHIWDGEKGQFAAVTLHKSEITDDMVTTFTQMSGRVLRRDKPKGYVFTESDFLPKGSREGLVGGIPPGKRAIVLDASKINGVFGLRAGDHVDILSSQTLDLQKSLASKQLSGPNAALMGAEKRAATHVLVQDGVLVTPVTTRTKPVTSNSLTQGTSARLVPVQEVTIAIDPEEVSRLNGAITAGSTLTCVPRSGQAVPVELRADDSSNVVLANTPNAVDTKPSQVRKADHTPSDDPLRGLTVIETVVGGRKRATRETLVFPSAGRGPLEVVKTDGAKTNEATRESP